MEHNSQEDESRKAYHSVEEYNYELIQLGKEWIYHYCRGAVSVTPEGNLQRIRGKFIFAEELDKLCEQQFNEKEEAAFETETRRLCQRMEQIHRKSQNYIEAGEVIAMEYIYRIFGFGEFEWYLFAMAFLMELDSQFERVFGLLQDDLSQQAPSLDLCIKIFTLSQQKRLLLQRMVINRWDFLSNFFQNWDQSGPSGREWGSILSVPLKLDTRIIRFLYDMTSEDTVLKGCVRFYLPAQRLRPMLIREELTQRLKRLYARAEEQGFLCVSGDRDIGKKFLMRHFCRESGRALLMVDFRKLPSSELPLKQLIKILVREAALKGGAVVCFEGVVFSEEDRAELESCEHMLWLLERTNITPVFLSAEKWNHAIETCGMRCVELELSETTMEEREILWQCWLQEREMKEGVDPGRLADRYKLPPGAITRALDEAESQGLSADPKERQILLYKSCQKQLIHKLGKDAVKISTKYTMEDLILPKSQKQMLKDACSLVEYRYQVYDKWGFDKKVAYGKGISMIFYGPPGTGKTMGAQAIAGELNLELYRVDMAGILSKYVGESEKKLGNIFEQGQKSQSILFFDEADALFGKRSEVKDSQDKYANASTAYLLQKIEEYEGIIILATNLLQNFDAAFCRRFKFIIEFPFPDEERRKEIWKKVFPSQLPMEEEPDYEYLAGEFVFSGSQIKNIAVAAAFLAAGDKNPLNMRYILTALKREVKKTGKNMIAGDFGKYYSLMEAEKGEEKGWV